MRKISFIIITLAMASMMSCSTGPKPLIRTELDSVAYAIGYSRTEGLTEYLQQIGVDTLQMTDFMRGVREGVDKQDAKDIAYMYGLQIGHTISSWKDDMNKQLLDEDATESFDLNLILKGFIDGVDKSGIFESMSQAQAYANLKTQALYEAAQSKKTSKGKEEGTKFLEENKTKEGVITLESGLQYKVLQMGTGEIPTAQDKVKVNYWGKLINGTQFDSSYDRNEPAEFGVTQVIKGWTEVLQLMPVGSKWEVYIPYDLAYGEQEQGSIPACSTLIFQIELLEIVK